MAKLNTVEWVRRVKMVDERVEMLGESLCARGKYKKGMDELIE